MRRSKHSKRRKRKINVIFCMLLLIGVIVVTLFGIFKHYENKIFKDLKVVEMSRNDNDLGISNVELDTNYKHIENIAVFGIDSPTYDTPSRSDSIIILSIDRENNSVKLSSIMRDTYVNIEGHGYDKINHAYMYGGPELAVKTINQNFNLNIRNYVTINYYGVKDIIDDLGGVEIDIREDELGLLNNHMESVANDYGLEPQYLNSSGLQNLTGLQAVGYSRIRYVGNYDFERTDRQRKVLVALFQKVKSLDITKYPSLAQKISPLIQTSLQASNIQSLLMDVVTIKNIDEKRFPQDGFCEGKIINDIYYLTIDEEATKQQIFDYIYK